MLPAYHSGPGRATRPSRRYGAGVQLTAQVAIAPDTRTPFLVAYQMNCTKVSPLGTVQVYGPAARTGRCSLSTPESRQGNRSRRQRDCSM